MTASQVIVLAMPVFLLMIGAEYLLSVARDRRVYRLSDAVASISLGALSEISNLFTKVLAVGIYAQVYDSVARWPDAPFWSSWYGALLALVFYDFCYYWQHRAGHRIALFWAAHVVHHQSQRYNLSTALRQTSSGALLGWIFYLPMAIVGVPPLIVAIVALVDLLYQFWVHTELVGKLGWFDRFFCAPSNHRVHHAINDQYLDKNYGGILIVWDRLFGSYREEREDCIYGTRSALRSWDPLWANTEVYWSLVQDTWRAQRWGDKLRVWFEPPGWRPPDIARRWPKPAFDLRQVDAFDPPLDRTTQWFAGVQFMLLLAGVALVLWFAGSGSWKSTAICSAALVSWYWALGAVLQGRLSMLAALLLQSAALAIATSALTLPEWHQFFKPLTMVLAIVLVWRRAVPDGGSATPRWLLATALLASLAGDMFLLRPANWFIPGLAAFLVAHLFYLNLFRVGQSWFPSRRALLATLGFGAAMLVFLWGGLSDNMLRLAVCAYVLVIALMTAQAIGRATVLRDAGSTAVALGACVFMASDTLIAINRFIQPLPMANLWILSTYYTAQILIVLHALPESSHD